jgi:ParB/RepB/Spo0J family partition protein
MNRIVGEDKIVNIDLIIPNTWNPKESIEENTENKEHYEEIKNEIEKKGLFEAITVREYKDGYEILDGFHRWTACKELGYTEIRVNNIGKIDDRLARAITLIKEQKKVPISELKVAEVVGWYRDQDMEEDDVKELLGYSDEEFDEYSKLFDFDWNDYGTGDEDLEEEPKEQEEITCPKCGHKFYK